MKYNDLYGVLAKGAYWQPVKFGTQTGWVRQDNLMGLPDPGENPIYMPMCGALAPDERHRL